MLNDYTGQCNLEQKRCFTISSIHADTHICLQISAHMKSMSNMKPKYRENICLDLGENFHETRLFMQHLLSMFLL